MDTNRRDTKRNAQNHEVASIMAFELVFGLFLGLKGITLEREWRYVLE